MPIGILLPHADDSPPPEVPVVPGVVATVELPFVIAGCGSVAEELYNYLEPLAYGDVDNGNALWQYCCATAGMIQDVEDMSRDDGPIPGWSKLLDLQLTPDAALGWLGQFVGVRSIGGLTSAQQRSRIAAKEGFKRGSPEAMRSAAEIYLTGTRTVNLYERDTSPYHISVQTYESETPAADLPTTNLFPNGGFETNTTGVGGTNSTITRITSDQFHGTACAQVELTNASNAFIGNTFIIGAPLPKKVYIGSMYVKGVGAAIGKDLIFALVEAGGATGDAHIGTVGSIVLTGEWQRISAGGGIMAQADRTGIYWYTSLTGGNVGETYLADAVQVEEHSVVTPYIETNGATASRLAGFGPVGAALRSQKPAGIQLSYTITPGQTWFQLLSAHATWTLVNSYYSNWNEVVNDTP